MTRMTRHLASQPTWFNLESLEKRACSPNRIGRPRGPRTMMKPLMKVSGIGAAGTKKSGRPRPMCCYARLSSWEIAQQVATAQNAAIIGARMAAKAQTSLTAMCGPSAQVAKSVFVGWAQEIHHQGADGHRVLGCHSQG